jgi:hypothetical protein
VAPLREYAGTQPLSGHDLPEGAQTSEPSDILALRQALDLLNSNDRNILILREYLEMREGAWRILPAAVLKGIL